MTWPELAGTTDIAISLSVPLLLASLGELVVEKSGVIDVGMEGMILAGAFAAFASACVQPHPWVAAAFGMLAGAMLALLFALVAVRFGADQVVVGTALNILSLGVTGVLLRNLAVSDNIARFHPYLFPLPGHVSLSMNGPAIVAFVAVPLIALLLYRTSLGLRLRSVGEYPAAAEDVGVRIVLVRTLALIFGGAMAGLAGAYLSIGDIVTFSQGMSGNKGFIALAVVIVGRWSPVGLLIAALLFAAADALQTHYQASGSHIPYQLLLAAPYILTLVALTARAGKRGGPAALGEPYRAG